MSLDVYLDVAEPSVVPAKIFIREDGRMRQISREEWDAKFPGTEPCMVAEHESETTRLFSSNITHNLGRMAKAAGLYEYLWRHEEVGITTAYQLIEPLRSGLTELRSKPKHYRGFNPENGWGNYDGLVEFVSDYLEACERWPTATVSAWR